MVGRLFLYRKSKKGLALRQPFELKHQIVMCSFSRLPTY
jgi:hypothetical protein